MSSFLRVIWLKLGGLYTNDSKDNHLIGKVMDDSWSHNANDIGLLYKGLKHYMSETASSNVMNVQYSFSNVTVK